ncbi:MAG: LamG domain-containing protein [Spirochaetes bacterium]|nr:LamG domain-containing protein [Spirochaetota bacterium]MBU0956262.1 LamG domain-containing protein [Spirochaetota bacterium]
MHNYREKITHILPLLFCAAAAISAGAQTLQITPESRSASSAQPWLLQGVNIQDGPGGTPAFILEPAANRQDPAADLLLAFNDGEIRDLRGNWTVQSEGFVDFVGPADARIGSGSAAFISPRGKLVLEPKSSLIFSPGTASGDFSIDFWLKPSRADNGEVLLLYRSTLLYANKRFAQQLAASISRNRMTLAFFNFFVNPSGAESSFTLQGSSLLVPGRWSHHLVRFDVNTGLLEYVMDGKIEAVNYVTATGREGSTVFTPIAGTSMRFDLAPNYTGLMDEFRISRSFIEDSGTGRYTREGGLVRSPVFDLGSENSLLLAIESRELRSAEAMTHYSYRFADTARGWTDAWPEWQPFVPGKALPEPAQRGRFLQLQLELYPDAALEASPLISSLTVLYQPDLPPPPPAWVLATAGDGRISVEWSVVSEADVAGYALYYGTSPGQYYGTGANEGSSPIIIRDARAVSTVLSGLSNGTLYFIAVAALDSAEPPHVGEFSTEVTARPARIKQ